MSTTLPPPVQDSVSVPSTSLPHPSHRPSSHQQKYDRQLRLWASQGQLALENAHVLVVGSNATATSALKNLVLPGFGNFTVLDEAIVDEGDLGANFFLEPSSLGRSRADEAVKFLGELNSDVNGHAIQTSLATWLDSSRTVLAPYSLVLAVDVGPRDLATLCDRAWDAGVPLIQVESCGFFGTLTTQVEEVCIVETHPESLIDLRLSSPFPALVEYSYSPAFDYALMDSKAHGHVPAVVILIKGLEEWKESHNGSLPTGTAERTEFISTILKEKRAPDEENFDEAVALYRRAGTRSGIPSEIKQLFEDPACKNLDSNSSNFWILVHALERFSRLSSSSSADAPGVLPLTGSLPDMKAESRGYVELQNIYRAKARQDLEAFSEILDRVVDEKGIAGGTGRDGGKREIAREEVESFVKHSGWLKVVRGRKITDMQRGETSLLKGKIAELFEQATWSSPASLSLQIHLALVASSRFKVAHSRYPGETADPAEVEKDLEGLREVADSVLREFGHEVGERDEGLDKCLQEVCRAAHSTLPQTSALLGGLVAQEAIKLVTKQYVPLVGTCVWDGIHSMTGRIET
ncbi:hypothetical protein JCM10212_006598 [Sporobolomyces blumeae]